MSQDASAAADAFALLGNEIRLAIVEALANDGYQGLEPSEGRSFADLRRAVGVRDAGRFNYHLGQLLGTFVRKAGEGYALTNTGWTVASIAAAGAVGADEVHREEPLGVTCPRGDARSLVGTYEDDLLRVDCPEHGVVFATRLPRGVVRGRSLDDVLTVACREMQGDIDRAIHGVCPHCRGEVETTVATDVSILGADDAILVDCSYDGCGLRFRDSPGLAFVTHPAVVSFYHEHGVDARDLTYPELPFLDPRLPTVREREPLRIELPVTHGESTLRLLFDGEARVVQTERD